MVISMVGNLLGLIVPITCLILFYRHKRLRKIKHLLDKWFYVDLIHQQADFKSEFLRNILRFSTKFFEGVFVFIVPFIIIQMLMSLSSITIVDFYYGLMVLIATLPMIRFIIWIQIKIHGVR